MADDARDKVPIRTGTPETGFIHLVFIRHGFKRIYNLKLAFRCGDIQFSAKANRLRYGRE